MMRNRRHDDFAAGEPVIRPHGAVIAARAIAAPVLTMVKRAG
jgi:hypothetical protein